MSELNTHDDHNPHHPANQIEVDPELTREQELELENEQLTTKLQNQIDVTLFRKGQNEKAKAVIDELIEYCESVGTQTYILNKLKSIEL